MYDLAPPSEGCSAGACASSSPVKAWRFQSTLRRVAKGTSGDGRRCGDVSEQVPEQDRSRYDRGWNRSSRR